MPAVSLLVLPVNLITILLTCTLYACIDTRYAELAVWLT